MPNSTQKEFDNLLPGDTIKCKQTGATYKIISLDEAVKINDNEFIRERYECGDKLITYLNRDLDNVFTLCDFYFLSHCTVLEKKEPEEPETPKITFILGKED